MSTQKQWVLALTALVPVLILTSCSSSKRDTATPASTAPATVSPTPPPPATASAGLTEPAIRVAISRSQPQAILMTGTGDAVLSDLNGRELGRLQPNQQLTVRAGSGAVNVASTSTNSACAGCVDLKGSSPFSLNGTPLSRRVTVWADASGTLTVVAWIDIEEYLLGVLAGEVPYKRWAPEALKAQAIVSRSYAMYQMKMRAAEPYDVETTEASQVFHLGASDPILQTAVNATRGQVVTCGGKLFPAYFHSTCGGSTTAAERVFPDRTAAATLRGTECAFCKHSPSFQWTCQIEKADLGRRLGLGLPVLGIEPILDPTGRAESVRVRTAGGERVLQGNPFRLATGSRELKSMLWTSVSDTGTQLRFEGRGFGHGVGMCQYGSDGMARAGYTCAQILGLYFPGGDLTTLYGATTTAAR